VQIKRHRITWWESIYLPAVVRALAITLRHLFSRKVTMQYPEERWQFPEYFRGFPGLVRDQMERVKCVACFLCEWVCPPKAIHIEAGELPAGNNVEKYPRVFEINMLRCINCGYCEEVCPEQAIFMTQEFEFVAPTRGELIFDKERLLQMGGVRPDPIMKWANK
jgi:NADH-quinone oxidoreductase subunit I